MSSNASAWGLENSHDRYTKSEVKRGESEHINCRLSSFHVRRVDEIIAARYEPSFKTRTDVLQDAIVMWLEDWDQRYPDGSRGEMSALSEMELKVRRRESRDSFMAFAKKEFEALIDDTDLHGIRAFLITLIKFRTESPPDTPQKFKNEVDGMIERARRLTSDEK